MVVLKLPLNQRIFTKKLTFKAAIYFPMRFYGKYGTNKNSFRIAAIWSIFITPKALKACMIENWQGKLMINTKY